MRLATATIAIPTRNRRTRLIPLLERLIPEAADLGAEILVVDNGSSDGTVQAVRALLGLPHAASPGYERNRLTAACGRREACGYVLAFLRYYRAWWNGRDA